MALQNMCEGLLQLPLVDFYFEEKFLAAKTNLEKVNLIYGSLKENKLFREIISDEKNDAQAINHREKGNDLFKKGKYLAAMECYTLSISMAKHDDIRALGYANRSHCLHKLKMYKECIADIDRAFANNYSGKNKEKLIIRKKEAEKLSKPSRPYYEEIPVITERNSHIQCASSCVKIEESEDFGRGVVATRNIEIGEVISVEKPFACILRSDFYNHCHECLTLCYNLIPCNDCTQALYCSEECLEEARNKYHKYLCPVLLAISKRDISWIVIALKVAIMAKKDYNDFNGWQYNKKDYYRSDRYKEIHLLTTARKSGFDKESFYKTFATAFVFAMMKIKTNFFEDEAAENAFKELLLHQIEVTSINGLNIYEYAPASDGICYENNDFAGGLYSFSSLYNHSCCRNVYRFYHGSTLVIRAINSIKKGQQCFINYGVHYDVEPLFARQETLNKQFFFTCKCKACEEDWEAHFVNFGEAMNISLSSREGALIHNKMAGVDLDFAKKYLPRFIAKLKKCEDREPFGEALTLKRMVAHCYDCFGNKKRM